MLSIEWGPVSAWVAAVATILATAVALLVAYRVPDALRAPRLRLTFEAVEPWCRRAALADGRDVYWVRIGVENVGRDSARGCIGRLLGLTTDGGARSDVDPIQLRWAGLPRSKAFEPVDLRRDQREFLNVLVLEKGARWRIVTFEDQDFDPGFSTELEPDHEHVLRVAVFADNAATGICALVAIVRAPSGEISLRLADGSAAAEVPPGQVTRTTAGR
jgi:hypothetical protein